MSTPAVARLGIGGNAPPGPIDYAMEAMRDLSAWMGEHPTIANADDARQAKALLDRARSTAGDIEAERDKLVRPLNEKITDINTTYKAVHNTDKQKPGSLDKVTNELKARLAAFIKTEEQRRIAEAESKRLAAEEANRASQEASLREREAIDNAKAGELGVDVTQVVVQADAIAAQAARATREAARAEQATHVKIGGGWKNAVSLRNVETLILDDPIQAVRAMGVNEKLRDSILSAARDYRKQHGKLPAGVSSATERHV